MFQVWDLGLLLLRDRVKLITNSHCRWFILQDNDQKRRTYFRVTPLVADAPLRLVWHHEADACEQADDLLTAMISGTLVNKWTTRASLCYSHPG